MDQRQSRTAADIVNGYEERTRNGIIRDYGEDKFAKNIANTLWLPDSRHRSARPENRPRSFASLS